MKTSTEASPINAGYQSPSAEIIGMDLERNIFTGSDINDFLPGNGGDYELY